jgi:endonuclease/exonuclease/phosphatase (EEP) superfamily protein YafD
VGTVSSVAILQSLRRPLYPPLLLLQAAARPLAVAGLAAAVGAARGRRPAVAALTLAPLAWYLMTRAGGDGGQRRLAPDADSRVTVLTVNLWCDNRGAAAAAEDVARVGADVVLLQEVSPDHVADVARKLSGGYPHRLIDARPGYFGSAIFSRFSLEGARAFQIAGVPMTRADVMTPAGRVHVVNVHLVAPLLPALAEQWHSQLEALGDLTAGQHGPLVVAGDFNATADHRLFRVLRRAGLREAGRSWRASATYPRHPLLPAAFELDHVLVRGMLALAPVRRIKVAGSDHYGLLAELVAVRPEGVGHTHWDGMG